MIDWKKRDSSKEGLHRSIPRGVTLVGRGMIVVLVAISMTVFIPGIIASHEKVFLDGDIRSRLPASAAASLQKYEAEKLAQSQSVANIKEHLHAINDPTQFKELAFYTQLLEQKQKETTSSKPPLYLIGFYLSPQMLLWPAIYSSLGCLLFCFTQPSRRHSSWKSRSRFFFVGSLIYVYYEWPLWARNFLLGAHGRTVYAYTNFDIDVPSFLAQEATIAGFAFLLAAVWLRWDDLTAAQGQRRSAPEESILDLNALANLQKAFLQWIISSVVLGLGFAYFTSFFWNLVAGYHDQRYILSAFLAHSLWVITWAFISMPLARSWLVLRERRIAAIEALLNVSQATPGKAEEINLDMIEKVENLAGVRISLAGIGAVISLLLPIVQLFVHK
jgi:hypothetical protein